MSCMWDSMAAVMSGFVMVSAWTSSDSMTALPTSVGRSGVPSTYLRETSFAITSCRVLLVPSPSSSIRWISLDWVNRAGGCVSFSSRVTCFMGSFSPVSNAGSRVSRASENGYTACHPGSMSCPPVVVYSSPPASKRIFKVFHCASGARVARNRRTTSS